MVQTTNQGEAFYRMKYLGGDTPVYRTNGNRFQELVENEIYEVYLSRIAENEISPRWRLGICLPYEGIVFVRYWDIEDFVEEWEDL